MNRMNDLDFENYRRESKDVAVKCELIEGNVIQSMMPDEEGKRFCFLLGTLFEDDLIKNKRSGKVFFAPESVGLDEHNVISPDLMVVIGEEAFYGSISLQKPDIIIDIVEPTVSFFDYMDKAMAYRKSSAKEYWLIDLNNQVTHIYFFDEDMGYSKYPFERLIRSHCLKGFECTMKDIMLGDGGKLKSLALFSKYKKEQYREDRKKLISEAHMYYHNFDQMPYTAQAFYEWMDTRKNLYLYTSIVELFLGEIREQDAPAYGHQNIRGCLFFEANRFIRENKLPYRLCFAPICVELTGKSPLDSVVVPDLFMIRYEERFEDNVFKGVPKWVVEIASPQTAGQDYVDKAQLYQYYGVEEYWIINEWKRKVLVLRYQKQDEAYMENLQEEIVEGLGNPYATSNVEEYLYDYSEVIPVRSIPGLDIKMNDLLREE